MNELAQLVSNALIGNDFINIKVGKKYYKVVSPTTATLAKMLLPLAKIEETFDLNEIVVNAEKNMTHLAEAISICMFPGCGILNRYRRNRINKCIMNMPVNVVRESFEEVIKLIYATDFFLFAQLAKNVTGAMAKQKQSAETR